MREERRLVAARACANFDDGVALVERVVRNQQRLELLLQAADSLLQLRDLTLRLGGHLGVVCENELAGFRELDLVFL